MEEAIEAKVCPKRVWELWEKAYPLEGEGKKQGLKYKVLGVEKGKSFSVLWKTLFVRMIFSHRVEPTSEGAKIIYRVEIKGLFAWPIRFFLEKKIRKNLSQVLHSIVKQLSY